MNPLLQQPRRLARGVVAAALLGASALAQPRVAPKGAADGNPDSAAAASTGSITGKVRNVVRGEDLSNAYVSIKGTGQTAISDGMGTYRFKDVPGGPVVLDAYYSDLDPQEIRLDLPAGGTVEHDIDLTSVSRYEKPAPVTPASTKLSDRFTWTYTTTTTSWAALVNTHNRKMLKTKRGLFAVWLKGSERKWGVRTLSWPSTWTFVRSLDHGESFSPIHIESFNSPAPPVLAHDGGNRFFVIAVDHTEIAPRTTTLHFHRFSYDAAKDSFVRDVHTTFPVPRGTSKITALYDRERHQVLFAWTGDLYRFTPEGKLVEAKRALLKNGPVGVPQYPHLEFSDRGELYFGWTSVSPHTFKVGGGGDYYDSHFMLSQDGGATWSNFKEALAIAVAADTSAAPLIASPSDVKQGNNNWLANTRFHEGKLHFMYLAYKPRQDSTQKYIRYDVAGPNRGTKSKDTSGLLKGATIELFTTDGYFATSGSRLFAVGCTTDNRVGVLSSDDNGDTWQDYARSSRVVGSNYYCITGTPDSFDGRYLHGMYVVTSAAPYRLVTFRVALEAEPPSVGPKSENRASAFP